MTRRFVLTSFVFCLVLYLAASAPVWADNLLDVVEAAQTTIQKKFPNRDSIARKMSLEELEKIARSGESDEQIINAVLEKFPDTFAELSAKYDQNFNGIPDEWEKKFNVSDGLTAPESDEDADGFSLMQEYKAGTDPADPLSHPKYITQIFVSAVSRQRFPGLELVSVDRSFSWNNSDWVASFHVIRNGRKRVEFVRIRDSFKHNNKDNFSVNDMEIDEKTKEPVVYIQRVGKAERIPCRPGQPVYDPSPRVRLLNSLAVRTFVLPVGGTIKLGSKKTGEETYRIVSADPDTKTTVVESVGEKPETFSIPPVPEVLPAAKAIATAKAAATVKAVATAKAAATAKATATAQAAATAKAAATAQATANATATAKAAAIAQATATAQAVATAKVPVSANAQAKPAAKPGANPAAKKSKATPLPIFHKRDQRKNN